MTGFRIQKLTKPLRCLLYLALIIAPLLLSPVAHSFNKDEHIAMGNLAFKLAINLHPNLFNCDSSDASPSQSNKPHEVCKLTSNLNGTVSYGEIVAAIDHALTGDELLLQKGNNLDYPTQVSDLNNWYFRKSGKIRRMLNLARATTNNEAHFREGVHYHMNNLHKQSIYFSRKSDGLFAALVYRAMADHYLHDYFAPGHLAAARFNVYDTISLFMHDAYNERGATFVTNKFDRFQPYLNYIQENGKKLKIKKSLLNEIERLQNEHESLSIFGDGFLIDNPRQELFIVLIELFHLDQIIQCHLLANDAGLLDNNACSIGESYTYKWIPTPENKTTNEIAIVSETHFGKYNLKKMPKRILVAQGSLSLGQETAFQTGDNYFSNLSSIYRLALNLSYSPTYPSARQLYTPTSGFLRNTWVGPALKLRAGDGYQGIALGLKATKAFPSVDLKFSGSFLYTATFTDSQEKLVKINIGDDNFYGTQTVKSGSFNGYEAVLRAELGFSLLTGYIEVGHGNAMYTTIRSQGNDVVGHVSDGAYIGLGTSFSFPSTRMFPTNLLNFQKHVTPNQ